MSANTLSRVSLFVVLVLTVCLAGQAAHASVVVVGTCKSNVPQYHAIGTAIASVPAGSTIWVCPGTYPEQLLITKNLTLIGITNSTGDAAVIVPPSGGIVANGSDIFGNPVAAQVFVKGASAVTISSLTVDGTGNDLSGCVTTTLEGIYFQNSSGRIVQNAVRNQFQTDYADFGGCQNGLAINVESISGSSTVTVSGNSVRSYQKNGITATGQAIGAGSLGPIVTVSNNYIVGLGATAMNWQGVYLSEGVAAENGIQIGFGATGTISGNTLNDNIWGQDTSSDTGDAASGILIYSSEGVKVEANSVGSAQFGIVAVTDPPTSTFCNGAPCGPADNNTITSNKVIGTQIFDGIDLCSNSNTVKSNTVYGSMESAIHVDDSCGSGNNNTVTNNVINEACAGILLGTGASTIFSPNTYYNVTNLTLAGDVCPVLTGMSQNVGGTLGKHSSLRPSPYKANKR